MIRLAFTSVLLLLITFNSYQCRFPWLSLSCWTQPFKGSLARPHRPSPISQWGPNILGLLTLGLTVCPVLNLLFLVVIRLTILFIVLTFNRVALYFISLGLNSLLKSSYLSFIELSWMSTVMLSFFSAWSYSLAHASFNTWCCSFLTCSYFVVVLHSVLPLCWPFSLPLPCGWCLPIIWQKLCLCASYAALTVHSQSPNPIAVSKALFSLFSSLNFISSSILTYSRFLSSSMYKA